ncbi:hypothetical protein CHU95_09480 [Niveispirillum lacus]|uniref:NmrA-like domain-containing protein n=1 Tax=Niveispirillum lacus TaxID=1981099 RepID=A0A255YZY2_9PROT|nr:NmrA family NAD(P)-binding protein [Niveispirillum lacus]OYQ34813.1 hypothetical protein CHU95_09480 [Niveispirillum lacus]
MKVLVFGATGDQGQAQLRRLVAAGHTPVAVARDPAKIAIAGVVSVVADYRDPDSLVRALDGIDALFITMPSTSFQAAEPLIRAVEAIGMAAQRQGLRMTVFNSSMIIKEGKRGFAAHDARWEMRERLRDSGTPIVSIQPVIYLDNLLRAWARKHILEEGRLFYPHHPELDVCWICQDDVSDLMIAALDRPHLSGRAYNVGGAEAIRGPDLARRLGAVLGRSLRFDPRPIPDFCAAMAGVFKDVTTLDHDRLTSELRRIYEWYNFGEEKPFYVDMAPVLADLPVTLTGLEDWAARQDWRP